MQPTRTDEAAIQLHDLQRLYGQAPAGEPAVRVIDGTWGPRKSFLPAISMTGVLAMTIQDGGVKRTNFKSFLEDDLVSLFHGCSPARWNLTLILFLGKLPMMNVYPDVNSILVCDNAPIHCNGNIQALCDKKGLCDSFFT